MEYNKSKMYKTLDCGSRDILNFNFLEKGQGIVSLLHFMNNFSRKMFLMLYSFNLLSANFTKWSNTLKQVVGKLSMNCLSVFDHFVGLALKGLSDQIIV